MGQHFYPCPTCYATQKVRAQSGEVVEIKDCDACAQEKERALDLQGKADAEVEKYHARQGKR